MPRKGRESLDGSARSRWTWPGLYAICFVVTVALLAEPIRNTPVRAGILVGLMVVWVGALKLVWNRRVLRIVALLFILPPLLVALAPDRPIDCGGLQAEYVHCLQRFKSVPYVWGGETHTGIDCSGLVRAGLVDAEIEVGIKTVNPRLLRHAAGLWWNDSSALALGDEFQGRTIRTVMVHSLNAADYAAIRPGDIAIIDEGKHAMVYIGERNWIEASPTENRVVVVQAPSAQDVYFDMEAQIVRWRIMDHP